LFENKYNKLRTNFELMEITRENTGEYTATVKIAISPSDYNDNVNKVLKDYQRKANVPGFRPGHVPFGLVKKMYGSAVFADEVNKLVSDALLNYVREEKLDILGQPLPNTELTPVFDWKDEKDIQFYFDLGLSPQFELKLDDSIMVDYHRITVSDEMIGKYIEDLRQRYGSMESVDVSSEKDVITGEFRELDADGNILEDGIVNTSKLMISVIKDDEEKKKFVGIKPEESVTFNPTTVMSNTTEVATMLGITRDRAENLHSDFLFTVKEISSTVPAEVNSEFFDKVFPESGIDNEEDFRIKLKAETENSFISDSDHLFMHHAHDKLLEITPMQLPDEFLKRWLIDTNEGKLSLEDLEKDYDKYASSMKWQLIENRIIKDFDIQVPDEEIKDYIKDRYLPGWRTMPLTEDLKSRLDSLADNFLETKHDDVRRLLDGIYEMKVTAIVKSKVRLAEKEISYEEFARMDAERH
jgi:trigger factor